MKKLFSALLITALMLGVVNPITTSAAWTDVYGISDSSSSNIDIYSIGSIQGSFSKETTNTYTFRPARSGVIKVTRTLSESYGQGVTFTLKKITNGVNTEINPYHPSHDTDVSFYDIEVDQDYTVEIYWKYNKDIQYSFSIEDMMDMSSSPNSAPEIKFGNKVAGSIYTKNDVDCFKFNSGNCNMFKIESYASSQFSPEFKVYEGTSNSDLAIVADFKHNSNGEDISGLFKIKKNTTYYVYVSLWNWDPGEYSFTLKGITDVSNTTGSAKAIKLNKTIKGTCEFKEDLDYYKFKATKSGTIKLTGNNASYFNIFVKRKGSSTYTLKKWEYGNYSFTFKVKKGKTYYVGIGDYIYDGDYSFKLKYK